jgi:hypothetical protein
MKYFLIFVVFLSIKLSTKGQCPTTILTGASKKCVKLTWTNPPNTLPTYVNYLGLQFNYVIGNGSTTNPAEYINSSFSTSCGTFSEIIGSITLPSGEVCTYGAIILPLQWLSFTVSLNEIGQTFIKWSVNETNTKEYLLESSTDGISFNTISNILSKSDGINTYTFLQNISSKINIYYRVKQISKDGTSTYSKIIKQLNNTKNNNLVVYPNPATNSLTISTTLNKEQNNFLQILNLEGKSLKTIYLNNSTELIDITNLKPGFYSLRLNESASTLFKKL